MPTFGLEDQDLDQEHEMEVPPSTGTRTSRGPNRSITTPHEPSQRCHITPEAGGFQDTNVVREMYSIFKSSFRGTWHLWKEVAQAERDLMFQRFQSKFQWDPESDDDVRNSWISYMQNRYSDWMKSARELSTARCYVNWEVEWDGEDFTRLRAHHPLWIPERFWQQMIDEVWVTERWRKKSRVNKANRKTEFEVVSSRHTGGSISTVQHRHKMRKAWGREPTSSEVYERVHCSNRKLVPGSSNPPTDPPQFIYPKAARIAERFKDLKDAATSSSQPDTPPPDEVSLWEQSVGGRKRGRLFGFGISQDPYFAMTGEYSYSTRRSSVSGSQEEVVALREKMNEMEERHRAELEAEKKKREEIENQLANQAVRLAEQSALSEHFTTFMRQQGYIFPPPGPSPPSAPTSS